MKIAINQRFSLAVDSIYDAATSPEKWPLALQAMADVFEDVGALLVYQRDDGRFGYIHSASLAALVDDYKTMPDLEDIRSIRAVERGYYLNHEGCTDSEVVTALEMDQHPLYQFLARHGLKYFVAAMVSPDPRVNVSIAVQRLMGRQPYSRRELELMVDLGHHAERSLRLSIRLLDAELANLGLRDALSRIGIGTFALDASGRIVFSNPAGQQLLGNGLIVVDGRLRIAPSTERNRAEEDIARALDDIATDTCADPKPVIIERQDGRRPLILYALPITATRTPEIDFLTHARALILAIDPDVHDFPDPSLVRDVLGLTLSEAKVAALVGSGMRPAQAAIKLGITEETARTALKRVFSKTGVSHQSELTALLAKLVLK